MVDKLYQGQKHINDVVSSKFQEEQELVRSIREKNSELEQQRDSALTKLSQVPVQIKYKDIELGSYKYKLSNEEAKEFFEIKENYDSMFIFKDYVFLCKDEKSAFEPIKIYSREKIKTPVHFDEWRLKVTPNSKDIKLIQDKEFFEYISGLEKE